MSDATRHIVTFSRRTDPAFFLPWFMECIHEGYCTVPNPFSGKVYTVSLKQQDVHLFSFWTKDPAAFPEYVSSLRDEGYALSFFVCQTNYPRVLEPSVPGFEQTRDAVSFLAAYLSSRCLWWRYDPILLTRNMPVEWHVENFEKLCEWVWSGNTSRVVISLAHIDGPYSRIRSRLTRVLKEYGDDLVTPTYEEFRTLAIELRSIARRFGISLEVCCSPRIRPEDLGDLPQGQCLSMDYLREIVPDLPDLKCGTLRKGSEASGYAYAPCTCVVSRDIGTRGTCRHGCVYCYANR